MVLVEEGSNLLDLASNENEKITKYPIRKRTINLRKRKQFYCKLSNWYDQNGHNDFDNSECWEFEDGRKGPDAKSCEFEPIEDELQLGPEIPDYRNGDAKDGHPRAESTSDGELGGLGKPEVNSSLIELFGNEHSNCQAESRGDPRYKRGPFRNSDYPTNSGHSCRESKGADSGFWSDEGSGGDASDSGQSPRNSTGRPATEGVSPTGAAGECGDESSPEPPPVLAGGPQTSDPDHDSHEEELHLPSGALQHHGQAEHLFPDSEDEPGFSIGTRPSFKHASDKSESPTVQASLGNDLNQTSQSVSETPHDNIRADSRRTTCDCGRGTALRTRDSETTLGYLDVPGDYSSHSRGGIGERAWGDRDSTPISDSSLSFEWKPEKSAHVHSQSCDESPPLLSTVVAAQLRSATGDEALSLNPEVGPPEIITSITLPAIKENTVEDSARFEHTAANFDNYTSEILGEKKKTKNFSAKKMFQQFMSTIRSKISINSRCRSSNDENVEATDIYIVDESQYHDWIILDTQSYSGTLCAQSEVTIEPTEELSMTFLIEHDFIDWVVIREYTEKRGVRRSPPLHLTPLVDYSGDTYYDALYYQPSKGMVGSNSHHLGDTSREQVLEVPPLYEDIVDRSNLKTIAQVHDESYFEKCDVDFTFTKVRQIPIESFRQKGYVHLDSKTELIPVSSKNAEKRVKFSNDRSRKQSIQKKTAKAVMSVLVFLGAMFQGYVMLMKYV